MLFFLSKPANRERWRREGKRILGTKLEEPLDLPLTASSNSFSLDLARGVNVRASVERQNRKTREARAVAEKKRESLPFLVSPRLAPSVTRVVIFVSRAFFSTNYKKNDCSKSLQCVYTFSCLVRFVRRTRKKKVLTGAFILLAKLAGISLTFKVCGL